MSEPVLGIIGGGQLGSLLAEAAKKIKIPTLSILATGDKMCPVKEGKKLADLIDNSRVEIIDNCGHMMLLEEADRVLKVLKQFILEHYPAKKLN